MPIIVKAGGGVNISTLPDQITNLTCVGGTDGTAGTIDVQFTESSSTSWSLLKNYVLVYKAGSIPQTPFDGTRIALSKSTAETTKTYQITGLTFDQLYGVRIYPVSIKNQYQTLAEGATATVTPVNTIRVSTLAIGTLLHSSRGNYRLVHKGASSFIVFSEYAEDSGTLHTGSYFNNWPNCSAKSFLISTVIPNLGIGWQKWLIDSSWQWSYGWSDYVQSIYTGKGCFPSLYNLNIQNTQALPNGDIVWDYFVGADNAKRIFTNMYPTSTSQNQNSYYWAIATSGAYTLNTASAGALRYALSLSTLCECNPVPNLDGSYTLM